MKNLSYIISSLFHPAFVPLLGFLMLYNFSGYALYLNENILWFSLLLIFQFTILIPISTVYYLYWKKKISSIELNELHERRLPLIINLICYTIAFYIFYYLNFPKIISSFFGALALSAALSMIVSLYYKISLHMIAWGALTGALFAYALNVGLEFHFYFSLLVLVSAIVASARLWLHAHDIKQILAGWFSAAILSFLAMNLL